MILRLATVHAFTFNTVCQVFFFLIIIIIIFSFYKTFYNNTNINTILLIEKK